MKKIYVYFLLFLSIISITYAYNNLNYYVTPLQNSELQPYTSFEYDFKLSDASDCSSNPTSFSKTILTNSQGVGLTSLNLDSLLTPPSFICEYKDSSLRKIHEIGSQVLYNLYLSNDLVAKNDISGLTMSTNNISLKSALFNLSVEQTGDDSPGTLKHNSDDDTLEYYTTAGQVIQLGRELSDLAKNYQGSFLPEGTVVALAGYQGDKRLFISADSSNLSKSSLVAILTTDCEINGLCPVTVFGDVRDVDTSAWTSGDKLWINPSEPGNLTNVEPILPNNPIVVGYVGVVHSEVGSIFSYPNLNPSSNFIANNGWFSNDLTIASLTESMQVWTDENKQLISKKSYVSVPISFETYDAEPSRLSESNIHGGLQSLAISQPLSTGVPIIISKGTGKFFLSIDSGSDFDGTITITGDSVDRNTGAVTVGDTDIITIETLTTDDSSSDSNGNVKHIFTDGYISDKWFTGSVTLSTSSLSLTGIDVYHISFEQFNDAPNITLDTFDVNLYTTNVNAEFDAYLFDIHRTTGNKADIELEAELHLGADGQTAITDKYWRLRKGNINDSLNGLTDGVWVDLHYSNSPAYIEDVTMKVWGTRLQEVQ